MTPELTATFVSGGTNLHRPQSSPLVQAHWRLTSPRSGMQQPMSTVSLPRELAQLWPPPSFLWAPREPPQLRLRSRSGSLPGCRAASTSLAMSKIPLQRRPSAAGTWMLLEGAGSQCCGRGLEAGSAMQRPLMEASLVCLLLRPSLWTRSNGCCWRSLGRLPR